MAVTFELISVTTNEYKLRADKPLTATDVTALALLAGVATAELTNRYEVKIIAGGAFDTTSLEHVVRTYLRGVGID